MITASSVDEASELASNHDFELSISDIGMPNADGYELIRVFAWPAPERQVLQRLI